MDDLERRFWPKVRKSDGCWLWTGGGSRGYGQIGNGQGGLVYAHRVSYELAYGPIPSNLCVLHHCDVRNCVRPSHLYAGTKWQNARDALTRHRMATGERHRSARLNIEQVRDIRASKEPARILAARYGVKMRQIHAIKAGERWAWDR